MAAWNTGSGKTIGAKTTDKVLSLRVSFVCVSFSFTTAPDVARKELRGFLAFLPVHDEELRETFPSPVFAVDEVEAGAHDSRTTRK